MEVVGDEGVHPDAEVVVHEDGGAGEADPEVPPRHHLHLPPVHLHQVRLLCTGVEESGGEDGE